MNSDNILEEEKPHPGVMLLRLHRPAALNALNLALRRRIAQAFTQADGDPAVKVIILAGGERAFCAGADLHEYVDATPVEIIARDMDRLWGAVSQCRKPVIAAVRGHALGGGCELAMHADIIVAGHGASFGQPEIRIGLMPGGGATQRLIRSVGKFHAMKLLLTGKPISATHAAQLGLVTDVVEDDQVEPFALELAREICSLPVLAAQLIKSAVLESMNSHLDAGLRYERRSFQVLFSTADKTEGIRARIEKRPPRFDEPTDGTA